MSHVCFYANRFILAALMYSSSLNYQIQNVTVFADRANMIKLKCHEGLFSGRNFHFSLRVIDCKQSVT